MSRGAGFLRRPAEGSSRALTAGTLGPLLSRFRAGAEAGPVTSHGGARRLRAERPWLAVLEVLLIAALYAADVYGYVPLSTTPFFFAIGWISLRARGLRWRDVGFTRPPRWSRALLLGAGAGAAMELFSTFVSVPLLSRLAGAPPDLSDLRPMVGNLGLVLALLVPMWLLAAFGEELVFRGYLMNRVAGLAGGTPAAWLASLVAVSIAFGTGHDSQGLTGMIQESLAGLMLGALYLAAGRNLALPIVAHGVSNTVAFALIYCGWYPGV